jgi:glycosyltransferase involved in cell wall biosynthesis
VRIALVGTGVHAIPPAGYGAVETILHELATALRRSGESVEVINEVRRERTWDEYAFARSLPRLLQGQPFDVVHASTPVVAGRLARLGLPYVYTSHSRHWFWRRRLSHHWGYWLERRAVRRSRAAVALTRAMAAAFRGGLGDRPAPPVSVIPYGVDLERFRPCAGSPDGELVVLGVGVVLPFKRWEIAAAATRDTGARFVLVGPTPDARYAERVRAVNAQMQLLGEVPPDRLPELYATSAVLLHPSAVEVLPRSVVEAFASGIPVMGTDAIASVIEDGVTGWAVPEGPDPATTTARLRERLRSVLADSAFRRRVGSQARRHAEQYYAWPRIVSEHRAVYESVRNAGGLNRPGSPPA